MCKLGHYFAIVLLGLPVGAHSALPTGAELRAYLNESCIVADEPYYLPDQDDQMSRAFPFAGIIVGKLAQALIGGAIRATAAQFDSASKQKDMYFVAAKDVNLYSARLDESPRQEFNNQLACVTVVAADFAADNTDCTHLYQPRVVATVPADGDELAASVVRDDESVENVLRRANVCLEGTSRSVYEFRFEYSEDGTAFRVEHAGLWMTSLLSSDSTRAKRDVVYTVDFAEPGTDARMRALASAWIHVGTVQAGISPDDLAVAGRSEWLRVPVLSGPAAAAYQRDTAVHQDVHAEILALERAVTRNKRLLEGLEKRVAGTSDTVRDSLNREIDALQVKILRGDSMLDARRAEYGDLPQAERHYMPITLRISVIESRSERRALATLAAYLEKNSESLAAAATDLIGTDKSLDAAAGDADDQTLDYAREVYFDALIAVEEAAAVKSDDVRDAEQNLAHARAAYNAERELAGIPTIE